MVLVFYNYFATDIIMPEGYTENTETFIRNKKIVIIVLDK